MFARSIRTVAILAVAAATVAFPAAALADGTTDSLSAVDSIASDVSVDGTTDSSSSDVSSEASDSATTDTYGGTTESVPPVTDECASGGVSDSDGNPCEETTTTTETPTDTDGGGGVEEAEETPAVSEPVAGGGTPTTEEVSGGGGPELPFTGLPLWYAIYGGIALMVAGIAFWIRARFAREG